MTIEEIKKELSDVLLDLGGLSFSDIYSLLEEDSAITFEGEDLIKIARHFAKWQKQQMKEALQTEYEKGRFDMREEMMKDANKYMFLSNEIGYAYACGCRKTMQDFLEKACEWLEDQVCYYSSWEYNGDTYEREIVVDTDKMIEQFKNYMQYESEK